MFETNTVFRELNYISVLGFKFTLPKCNIPVTVAERSKACTVFARSEAGIVNSNRTQSMGV
jgi:hypothetical protein